VADGAPQPRRRASAQGEEPGMTDDGLTPIGDSTAPIPKPPVAPLGPLGGYWRIVLVGVLLVATVVLHAIGGESLAAVRGGVTLAFMAAGPGLAIMGLLRLDDLLLELSLALALSLVIETILAMAMLLLRHWIPSDGLMAVEVLAGLGVLLQVNQVSKLKQRNHLQHATNG